MEGRNVEDLILLVGYNPMPNYITACLLKPKRIHWLYTKDTNPVRKQLEIVLHSYFPDLKFEPHFVSSATRPSQIRAAMEETPRDAWLNYTGGTKAMTVQAYRIFMERNGNRNQEHASYLDGYDGELVFDDGSIEPIKDLPFTIKDALTLHGLEQDPPEKAYHDKEATDLLLEAILGDPTLAGKLYESCCKLRHEPSMVSEPINLGFLPEDARPKFARNTDWPVGASNNKKEGWGKYLTGGWFEDWVEGVIQEAAGKANITKHIAAGVRPKAFNEQSELDVLVVRDYHIRLISCTTSSKNNLVKSKCYEAQNRVELVGGDLARAAVVCFLPPEKAAKVQSMLKVPWQSADTTVKVFNIEDIRAWAGFQRKNRDYSTLTDWLTL